ncbi:MAG: tetratricopeptide repeat protein [Pararhodobacter sp.]
MPRSYLVSSRRSGRRLRAGALVLAGLLVLAPPLQAQTLPAGGFAGALLAAREAGANNDFAGSLPYLERMLAIEPDSLHLLESVTIASLALGRHEQAASHGARLLADMPENYAASLALLADAFARQDFSRALVLAQGEGRTHPLVDGLAVAWAHLGQGRMTEALAALDAVAAQDGMLAFAQYCRALALALVGDAEGAAAAMEDEASNVLGSLSRRGLIAYAQVLGQLERFDDALALIDEVFGPVTTDGQVARMRAAYAEGRALPFDLISDPAQGMAEVFAVMASAMRSAQNTHDALLYARAAEWVNPALYDTRLLIGQLFEEMEQPRQAAAVYAEIPEDDVFGLAAAMGQAQTLEALGDLDGAIAVLERLVAQNPQSVVATQVLGDFLRRDGRHDQAIAAYDRSFELMEQSGLAGDWRAYFSRAVSHERLGQWPEAEADFRSALAIEPDQPTVLNYLGYSLVERQEKLEEALEMIERAVAGEPDSGYIVDSLAWALYRLGRYDEALPHMERAVELLPTDPILNDHLGDVYWAVGRQREAQFQWRRALSYGPHDDLDLDRVRRKLEVGLDQVLQEEGAPPLRRDR